MVNKHANRGSISSSRKNKIIIHIATHSQESLKLKRQYLELTRMGSNQNTQSLWECVLVRLLCKTVWQSLLKLNMFIAYDPAILLNTFQQNCTQMFIKRLQKNIHSSTICNRQELETTQLLIKKRTND